jgi:hypothetical protein
MEQLYNLAYNGRYELAVETFKFIELKGEEEKWYYSIICQPVFSDIRYAVKENKKDPYLLEFYNLMMSIKPSSVNQEHAKYFYELVKEITLYKIIMASEYINVDIGTLSTNFTLDAAIRSEIRRYIKNNEVSSTFDIYEFEEVVYHAIHILLLTKETTMIINWSTYKLNINV